LCVSLLPLFLFLSLSLLSFLRLSCLLAISLLSLCYLPLWREEERGKRRRVGGADEGERRKWKGKDKGRQDKMDEGMRREEKRQERK
jgi:hypothetical protein